MMLTRHSPIQRSGPLYPITEELKDFLENIEYPPYYIPRHTYKSTTNNFIPQGWYDICKIQFLQTNNTGLFLKFLEDDPIMQTAPTSIMWKQEGF